MAENAQRLASAMAAERVYAAQRVDTGVYVQPANNGERFYVIASYQDGRVNGLEEGPWLATYWAWGELTRAEGERIQQLSEYDPESALSDLRAIATGANTVYRTKREATDAALEAGAE
jgi:3'-phosphoadenosine 5'-phosphosulfate sulfotransferase